MIPFKTYSRRTQCCVDKKTMIKQESSKNISSFDYFYKLKLQHKITKLKHTTHSQMKKKTLATATSNQTKFTYVPLKRNFFKTKMNF